MKIEHNTSLISVYGVGNIKIQPNIIKIFVKISKTSKTINEAQIEVNKKIKTLLNIFSELNIENINTNTISFHPEYEWENHKNILVGQKVEQEIIIIINDLKNNLQKAKDLLDKITLEIETMHCRVDFGIDNYEEKTFEARNLAYNNAFEKAKQYAKLANLKIIKTIKISEFEPRDDDYEYDNKNGINVTGCDIGNDTTELPISDITIERKLFCDFLAE
jgi:uncharacterized protein YggE